MVVKKQFLHIFTITKYKYNAYIFMVLWRFLSKVFCKKLSIFDTTILLVKDSPESLVVNFGFP